ncbi:PRC and DUF2382 domain-containing protein [Embleya sp. NPDC127516]|uniref:PRC and DUF2382 domain-containing protein n=1 Tax=Embleya sp. NPDC127516 TaxID=3363990 RepID=UPI0038041620
MTGATVHDPDGAKVGTVQQVYLDDRTGRPEWVTVRTGLFGNKESFVPLEGADLTDKGLRIAHPKDLVKHAPRVDDDGHLDPGEEQRLYSHYGLDEPGNVGDRSKTTNADSARAVPHTASGDRDKGDRGARPRQESADRSLTRSEEHLVVGVERRETGHARLRKYVVTEEVTTTVPVSHQEVRVERDPITDADRAGMSEETRLGEEQQDVTLYEERPVVRTEVTPVERVGLRTDEVTRDQEVTGKVRKERVDVEGVDEADDKPRKPRREGN